MPTAAKGKKKWKKNSKINDIEQGLEVINKEKQEGGIIEDRSNQQLFFVDKAGSSTLAEKAKLLVADKVLKARSALPEVSSRKRKVKALSWNKKQELNRLAKRPTTNTQVLSSHKNPSSKFDVWDRVEERDEFDDYEYIKKPVPVKPPPTKARPPIPIAETDHVPLPDPGISYNPDEVAWKSLIAKEGAKVVESEKKRLGIEAHASRIHELSLVPDAEIVSESEDEVELLSKGPAPKRKTAKQKRKAAERKLKEKRQRELVHEKHQLKKIGQAKSIVKRLQHSMSAVRPEKKPKKVKLSKHSIRDDTLDVQLADELVDSLRKQKPEGNLIVDRMKNLQKRGIIEPRVQVIPKKKKRKATEKYSYKEFSRVH